MYLKSLKIRNFRNFYKAEMNFNSEDTILIGENGSGKTNLFSAISLVLDVNYRLVNNLSIKDFNKKIKYSEFGEWIIISALLTGFEKNEDDNISLYDFDIDENNECYINLFFKPKNHILEELSKKYKDIKEKTEEELNSKKKELDEFIKTLSIENDYEILRSFKKPFNFLNDNLYYDFIGDFENKKFENDDYKNSDYIGNTNDVINALKQINVTYIPAIRNVIDDLSHTNGMFSKLINNTYEKINDENKQIINDMVVDLNNTISKIQEFDNLKNEMQNKMDDVIKDYFQSRFEIESALSNDKLDLVKNLNLKIYDYNDVVDIWRKSLGEANIIFFALKLLESERKKQSFRSTILDLLLIEEPEAHLHGHLQKSLFRNLEENYSRQLIISTHSVNISEVCKISKMLILNNDYMETKINSPSNGMNEKEIRNVERYLDANRSMLLFSKNVMLVEGDAETIVIPWMFEKCFGVTLDEVGISIINIRSTFFEALLPLFHKDRITKRCSVVTDLDKDYTSDFKRKDAEKKGQERKKKLDKISENNQYVKAFYAENTFEIQLFEIKENLDILKNMVNGVLYKQKRVIENKIANLENNIKMKETIIDIAEDKGKGWFSLEFIDYCESKKIEPIIPKYILDALNNLVIHKNNFNIIKNIVLYLLNKIRYDKNILIEVNESQELRILKNILKKINSDNYILNSIIDEVDKID